MVKKRMSCLMGCQECNSIIMKSDSGELDGWMAEWQPRGAVGPPHMPEHPHPAGRWKQVNRPLWGGGTRLIWAEENTHLAQNVLTKCGRGHF